MSDDVILFDAPSDDGMLFLWWNQEWWDDDFLGGLWLVKKEKQQSSIRWNEVDETAMRSKTPSSESEPKPLSQSNDEVSVNDEITGSVDATIIKRAEKITQSSPQRWWGRHGWSWSSYTKDSKFNISQANKIQFGQGKNAKKRIETPEKKREDSRETTNFRGRQWTVAPKSVPNESWWSIKHNIHTDSMSWEERRKHATWQAVVFNRWWWGQKIWWSPSISQPSKKTLNASDYKVSHTISKKEEIAMGEGITVKEFAEKMWVPIAEVIKKFIANKMLLSLNSSIDFETATLIAMEFDIKVIKESSGAWLEDLLEGNLEAIIAADRNSETKIERPPIVTIMGHVDHGKTTLLDYLRNTSITTKEHGGITQAIWWSQIIHNGKKVTFIDTPGHELFTALRARGSKITDIVVIVVAADDGVMKQTIEAINHAKDAKVPIIVAITKIDKWVDNTEFIKTQLSEHGLVAEDRGWDVPIVKVSGRTWQGIDDLMDQILLHAEVSELVCDSNRAWIGVVLEAHKDIQKGSVTNMIVMTWTLKVWDILWSYSTYGKIKKMFNRKGHEIKSAHGWDPIVILGMNEVPEAWKLVQQVKDEKEAKNNVYTVQSTKPQWWLSTLLNKIAQGEITQINLVVKADSRWSLEALKAAIDQIPLPENIIFKIVHSDIGNFFDSDLDLAKASNGILVWFGTTISSIIKSKIDQMGITLKQFNIIYEITDYLEALATWMIKKEPVEVVIGKLSVLWVFYRKGNETIFWGRVLEGEVRNGSYFRILRWEEIIDSGKITSLQKGQDNTDKVTTWAECGMKAKVSKKIEVGDILEYFVME